MRKTLLKIGTPSHGVFKYLPKMAMFILALSFSPSAVCSQAASPIFDQKNTFGIGPRAMGMGGAFTAIADDASAAYWNPAGLAQISAYEFALSSAPVYFREDVNGTPAFGFPYYASIQIILPLAKENTLGISLFRPFHPQQDFYVGQNLSSGVRAEGSYLQNPSFQESDILLSYAARFSEVRDFSVGVNVKRITNDPYYIRYLGSDSNTATALSDAVEVLGFGVDIGLLYRIPITKYSEEFRVGIMLQDLVGQAQYTNGLQFTDSFANNLSYSQGAGFQTPIPPLISLGFAYKNHFLFKIRNITAFDLDQIADSRFSDSQNKSVHFGTEFWFLKDALGVRAGYSTPLYQPGTIHLGLSFRSLGGDFQTDVAYLQPVQQSANVASGSAIGNVNTDGINFEKFHIGVSYRFGGGEELPPPKVSAFVKPQAFVPSGGEKAAFYLDTTEDVTANRWSVLIYDENNRLVRGLRGRGFPPTKLLWSGEDDTYQPLPPGVYTWSLQVLDNLDHVGSTPVQTVEILGPPAPGAPKNTDKLNALLDAQKLTLLRERQRLTQLAQKSLRDLLGVSEAVPTTLPARVAVTPTEATGNTLLAEAGNVLPINFNNISPEAELAAHFEKNEKGEAIVAVSYRSKLTNVPYLYTEAAAVIKTTVNSVGTGLKDIKTRVYYGKNELFLQTPTQVAADYSSGRITQQQLLQGSDVQINGQKVGPNGF